MLSSKKRKRMFPGRKAVRLPTNLSALSDNSSGACRESEYSKRALRRDSSNVNSSPTRDTVLDVTAPTRPLKEPPPTANAKMNRIEDRSLFHFLSNKKASSDEVMFVLTAKYFGFEQAVRLAGRFEWRRSSRLRALCLRNGSGENL